MAGVPPFLLPHTVLIAPMLSWGQYGPQVAWPCFANVQAGRQPTRSGEPSVATVKLFMQLDAVCPVGSLATVPDGRRGWASEVLRHDGGGLPTPDHIEATISIGALVGIPFGETVTLLARTLSGRDAYGNDLYTVTETDLTGAAVTALTSSENGEPTADVVTDFIEVIVAPGTVVRPTDRLRVRGDVYEVVGRPRRMRDPMLGVDTGLRLVGQRTTG